MKRLFILLLCLVVLGMGVVAQTYLNITINGITLTGSVDASGTITYTANGSSITITQSEVTSGTYISKLTNWVMSIFGSPTVAVGNVGNAYAFSGFSSMANRSVVNSSFTQNDIENLSSDEGDADAESADAEDNADASLADEELDTSDMTPKEARAARAKAAKEKREAKAQAIRDAQDQANDSSDPFIAAIKRNYNVLDGSYSFATDPKSSASNSWGGLYTLPLGSRVKVDNNGSFRVTAPGLMVGFRSVWAPTATGTTVATGNWLGDLISLGISNGTSTYKADKTLDVSRGLNSFSLLFDLGLNKTYKINYLALNVNTGTSYPLSIGKNLAITPMWGLNPYISLASGFPEGLLASGSWNTINPDFGVNLPLGLSMNLRLGDDFCLTGSASGNVRLFNLSGGNAVIDYIQLPQLAFELGGTLRLHLTDTITLTPRLGLRANVVIPSNPRGPYISSSSYSSSSSSSTSSTTAAKAAPATANFEPYISLSL